LNLANRVAVITGAGSGIGRATALAMARRGCHLALADIDEAGVAGHRARGDRRCGVRATTHRLDVADRAAVAAFPGQVEAAHKPRRPVDEQRRRRSGGTFEQVAKPISTGSWTSISAASCA
jgi:NAD(P)-dependent dehydrogenase (short-subunit alcohol dehydrogenase family)